jgi:hypothetical protein
LQEDEETKVNFRTEYFKDAVAEAFAKQKPILFLFTDFLVEDTKLILKEIFENEEVVRTINNEFVIFGLETGSTEANTLAMEFEIKEIPFFGIIMAKSETEYDVIDNYNEEEVEIDKFKDFLKRSEATFKSLIQYLVQNNQYFSTTGSDSIGGEQFVDVKHQEDRMIREAQKQEYERAQEEDRIKLQKMKNDEEDNRRRQNEEINYEQTKIDLANKKKEELPAEPAVGKFNFFHILGTTIKFREPVTGKSFTRRFNPTDQIHILYDFVQSKLDEIQFESS